jgi:nanoRNase/pAp phosphatase (c-di-AMP/oligoRNAs hydrolase)
VGYNPWSGQPLDTDISAICARHGGGGHPVVGGIAFPASEIDRARSVAREITNELADRS